MEILDYMNDMNMTEDQAIIAYTQANDMTVKTVYGEGKYSRATQAKLNGIAIQDIDCIDSLLNDLE